MRIVSLSCVYPAPGREEFGSFVRFRLKALARYAQIKVLSPVGVLDYSHPSGSYVGNRGVPPRLDDGELEVFYPRWIYPPGGASINGRLLAALLMSRVKRLHRAFPFQLIDAHFGYPDGIAASLLGRRLGIPYAITFRGNETMHAENSGIRAALARAVAGAARIIVLSKPLRDLALSLGADESNVKMIPNGIDAAVFHPRSREEMRRKLGLDPARRIVLSAGYLIERKGHHRVAEALAAIHKQSGPVDLLIAGGPGREGHYEGQIRAAVARSGMTDSVRFLGRLPADSVAEYMCAADLLCLASSREGWPNVLHEAMACGTPVVATAVGSVPEMVPSAGYGLVVPAGSEPALQNALLEALRRPWNSEEIARWARSRDWDMVGREVAEEFTQVLGAGSRVPGPQACVANTVLNSGAAPHAPVSEGAGRCRPSSTQHPVRGTRLSGQCP